MIVPLTPQKQTGPKHDPVGRLVLAEATWRFFSLSNQQEPPIKACFATTKRTRFGLISGNSLGFGPPVGKTTPSSLKAFHRELMIFLGKVP